MRTGERQAYSSLHSRIITAMPAPPMIAQGHASQGASCGAAIERNPPAVASRSRARLARAREAALVQGCDPARERGEREQGADHRKVKRVVAGEVLGRVVDGGAHERHLDPGPVHAQAKEAQGHARHAPDPLPQPSARARARRARGARRGRRAPRQPRRRGRRRARLRRRAPVPLGLVPAMRPASSQRSPAPAGAQGPGPSPPARPSGMLPSGNPLSLSAYILRAGRDAHAPG